MSESGAVHPNGIWKWIAAILVAIILAGSPGIVQAIKAPSKEDVNLIRDRQQEILVRLGVIDERIKESEEQLRLLQTELTNLYAIPRGD